MKPLSPKTKKRIFIRKNKGARDQKRGTKRICSDGACALPEYSLNYDAIKPLSRSSSSKKIQPKKVKRVSPNRRIKRKPKKFKPAIAYPGMEIPRRSSSVARSLQKKAIDPFLQHLPMIDGIKTFKNAIGYPGMKIKRRDSSIARSLQNKFNNSHNNKAVDPFPGQLRRDSSIARSLQNKIDESLARSLQRKHDLSYALELERIINNRGHPNDDEMIARALIGYNRL